MFVQKYDIRSRNSRNILVNLNVIVILIIMLSSSDDFSVATPDETNGQESEFSLVVSLRNKKYDILTLILPRLVKICTLNFECL